MRRSIRIVAASALAIALAHVACRDDVAPFEAQDQGGFDPAGGQLTFSSGDDRTPVWSPAGDAIYYSAEGFGHLPPAPGVLVMLPGDGGAAQPILTNVQLPNNLGLQRWLATPSPEPGGERIAFVEIAPLFDREPCPALDVSCSPDIFPDPSMPPLRQIILRVRRLDSADLLEVDPVLSIDMPGVTLGPIIFGTQFMVTKLYPFQQLFDQERAFTFRPSWSPNGERIVFSDGLRLLIWKVGDEEASPIPQTEDGVWPAWSPDGEWIAFTRLERADSIAGVCLHFSGLGGCEQERTEYISGGHFLNLIRPDGSDLTPLGVGDEPAWAPSGETLYYATAGQIWRLALSSGNAVRLPDAQRGREPAVSPDGRHLAYSKLSDDGDYDIWVLPINP